MMIMVLPRFKEWYETVTNAGIKDRVCHDEFRLGDQERKNLTVAMQREVKIGKTTYYVLLTPDGMCSIAADVIVNKKELVFLPYSFIQQPGQNTLECQEYT